MKDAFLKVACAVPHVKIADCDFNAGNILSLISEASEKGVSLVVFPELCITAYSCGDLFLQKSLQEKAKSTLLYIAKETINLDMIIVVGLPFTNGCNIYNCAAVIYHGEVLGLVPKTNLPNYMQYNERRYFCDIVQYKKVMLDNRDVPFGTDLIFACKSMPELKIGVEICEDLWVANPPSGTLAELGANVVVNLSASDEYLGKSKHRLNLIKSQSAKLNCAYIYANVGAGESTTDMVYSGHSVISENGTVLSESEMFKTGLTIAEIDLQLLESERMHTNFYTKDPEHAVYFNLPKKSVDLTRKFSKVPFIPTDLYDNHNELCEEALSLQTEALKTRMKSIPIKKVVIGVSGGLDSTLAMCVVCRTFDSMGIDRKNIIAVTMPCFGTSTETKNNAIAICNELGVTLREISIKESVLLHFRDIGQNHNEHGTTFENAQARERTQVLMDIANMESAIVVGTGDLSELALGFLTYNGDHMSMYSVNCGVPKTLVKILLQYESTQTSEAIKNIIARILKTPISPELLPPKDGEIQQKTEDIVGPYELHDFFLYYFLKYGFTFDKIFRLASVAFKDEYTKDTIKRCLNQFINHFFANQFKRSCAPDGPKIGEISLSPRCNFKMPSDATSAFMK